MKIIGWQIEIYRLLFNCKRKSSDKDDNHETPIYNAKRRQNKSVAASCWKRCRCMKKFYERSSAVCLMKWDLTRSFDYGWADSAKPRLRGYCTDFSIFSRLFKFSISLCRARWLADPYRVNSHKLPHKPRAVSSPPTRFIAWNFPAKPDLSHCKIGLCADF